MISFRLESVSVVAHLNISARSVFVAVTEVGERVVVCFETLLFLGARLEICEFWWEMLDVRVLLKLWLIRRLQLLVLDLNPVDAVEPGVLFNLGGVVSSAAHPLRWVLFQKTCTQVSRLWLQKVVVQFRIGILNVLVKLFSVLAVKGRQANQHLIDDAPERPPVSGLAVT